ncbi:MAG: menaquinol-cytochrome C reductase, partial [Thermicanus sp.]|nr:menaquinol-cytochrome C reductase [Thermicanus sp.]
DGVNVPNTPPKAPLDLYEYQVKDGKLYLGKLIQRT